MFEKQFQRYEYESRVDGLRDWYLFHEEAAQDICVVVLHGHGSQGDQLITRPDIAGSWVPVLLKNKVSVIAPNLRGNAWMSEAAVSDLYELLRNRQRSSSWRKTVIVSGSMGGTGALIFAMLHPELIGGVAALGAATDIGRYLAWTGTQSHPVLCEIHDAIRTAYSDEESLRKHNVCAHAEQLTMPVCFYHGGGDKTIPVSEARALACALSGKKDFYYREIENGVHDSPLVFFEDALMRLIHPEGER